jgi:hypothetical protein
MLAVLPAVPFPLLSPLRQQLRHLQNVWRFWRLKCFCFTPSLPALITSTLSFFMGKDEIPHNGASRILRIEHYTVEEILQASSPSFEEFSSKFVDNTFGRQ